MSTFVETIVIGIGSSIFASVIYSKANEILKNKDFKLAIKYFFDRSNSLPKRAEAYFKTIEIVLDETMPFSKYNKKIVIYLNSNLISAITKIHSKLNDVRPEEKKANTIVGMMLGEKVKKASKAQISLIACLLLHFILVLFSVVNFSSFLFVVISVGILFIHIDQKLVDYRIRKGWYGKNEFEAKEIINFVLSHSNKDDFNDSGGLKRIIPLPEIETKKEASDLRNHGGVAL
jgi:hypothetical protein